MTYDLTVGDADSALDERLSSELDSFNFAAVGRDDLRELTVRIEDGGELVAGLSGWTWAPAPASGWSGARIGPARRLGRAAARGGQAGGRGRGCRQVLVSSFTFQAPEFYARHGYVEFARSPDLPVEGQADVHFLKPPGRQDGP